MSRVNNKHISHTLVFCIFVLVLRTLGAAAADVCSRDYTENTRCECLKNDLNQTHVMCTNVSSIPEGFPPDVINIRLSSNRITEVRKGPFNFLEELVGIFLQDNYISHIQPGSFGGLMQLESIDLSFNNIRSLNRDVFNHLPGLQNLDLRHNRIVGIDRYAFFFSPSLRNVAMKHNNVTCGCEERRFNEFLSLGPLNVNAYCINYGDTVISYLNQHLVNQQYNHPYIAPPSCSEKPLFRPQSSRSCYTCADAMGLRDCQKEQNLNQCSGTKDICYIKVDYNKNHLGLYGGCMDYYMCRSREAENKMNCKNATVSSCYFCNEIAHFSSLDIVDSITTFNLSAFITLPMDMTTNLTDTQSLEYRNFVLNITTESQDIIYGENGAFAVDFVEFRRPWVTVALHIAVDTMWFVNTSEIIENVTQKLETIQYYGREVEAIHVKIESCKAEDIQNEDYGKLSWQQTQSNILAHLPCPYQISDDIVYASRFCDVSGVWSATNYTLCSKGSEIFQQLKDLARQNITEENIESISSTLKKLSENWEILESADLSITANVVEQLSKVYTASSSRNVTDNTIDIINNVLFVPFTIWSSAQMKGNAASRLVSAIEDIARTIEATTGDYTVVKDNIAMFISHIDDVSSFEGRSMSLGSETNGGYSESESSFRTSEAEASNRQSGIILHPSLLDGLTSTEKGRVKQISMYGLRDSKLYDSITDQNITEEIILPNKTVMTTRRVNSQVIAATVPGVTLTNLQTPVEIQFRHLSAGVNPECVYWDDSHDTRDIWSRDGCTVNASGSDITVCLCSHLTNFALIMDVYDSGEKMTKSDLLALFIISCVGCGLSCIAVVLTLVTYTCFKSMKKDNPSKIIINLCVAIGLVNIVFIVGVQNYTAENQVLCKTVAVLLHYSLLCVMCWMVVEACYMYRILVKISNAQIKHFALKSSIFGWGIPLLAVTITLVINKTDNYDSQFGGICWLERLPFYIAFLGPVCVTMAMNVVVFTLVLRQIFRRTSKEHSKSDSTRGTTTRVRGAISLLIILGLTWLFAFLAFGDFGKVFQYLFAVTNTLQGLFIFVFFCLLRTQARNAWKTCWQTLYKPDGSTIPLSKASELTEKTNISSDVELQERKPEMPKDPMPPKNTMYRGNWSMPAAVP